MTRDYKDYISDIVNAMEKIDTFTRGMSFQDFARDEKTVFAVIRALEIIGEAVKNIPATFKNRHKQIPWKRMAGMRDKLIHEYFGVDKEVLWRTIKEDIPNITPVMHQIAIRFEKR